MNFSLDALVKNLSNNDFKYLSEEFRGDLFEIVKQEGVYPYDYMDTEIDMHLFIEKEMRGGISYIAKKHSKANNKYMKCYNEHKGSKFIMHLDADNIYGWVLKQNCPIVDLII